MATKDQYLFGKANNIYGKPLNDQYSNLNLNHNYQSLHTHNNENSKNALNDSRKVENYDLTDSTDLQTKRDSNLISNAWNKSTEYSSTNYSNFNHVSEEKDEFEKVKSAKTSTLSLHIAAYENSVEDASDSNGGEKKASITPNFVKKCKSSKQDFIGSSLLIKNPFEFPRQQENQNKYPEVMHFKASQKLLKPNKNYLNEKKRVIVESSSEEDEEDFEGHEDKDIEETSGDEIEDESKNDDNDEVEEEEIEGEEDESEAEDNDAEDVESSEDEELNNLGNEGSKKGEISYSDKSFEELGIGKWLTKQLNEYGLTRPTPVQGNCIPKILEGSDVLGCAKTGTGKTLAFALPILQKLAVDPYGVFAVILTPTRELATQISDQFIAFGRPLNLQVCTVTGGRDQMAQGNELARKPHVVVATPGRLADYIESDPITIGKLFKRIQFLVLDEADQMLDGPYAAQLKIIFQAMGKKRQTLLFSATITSALTKLHQVSIHKPYFFEDIDDVKTVEKLEQRYVLCPKGVKDAYLVYVVKNFYENRNGRSVLVFAHTCRECQALALMFKGLGFNVGSLHSMIPQKERNAALSDFRSKKIRILICTDVAARGLDVPHVDLVVNHNIPREPKTYVHRVGRSARAGRFGSSVAFVTQYDISLLREIEKLVGRKLEKLPVSHKKVTTYVTDVLLLKREAEIKLERQKFGEQREIYKRKDLAMKGYSQEDIEKIMSDSKSRKRQPPVTSKMESLANRKTAKKRKA